MTVQAERLAIPDVILLRPKVNRDDRGFFVETANTRTLDNLGVPGPFVQDNQAFSVQQGVLRGLHYQKSPRAQGKLVRVLKGRIFDVAVDVRGASPTFGRSVWAELTADGMEQLWVPPGFAHGYVTLEPATEVFYKVTDFYAPETEGGVIWNDPALAIPWPVPAQGPVLSPKDCLLPRLEDIPPPF